MDNVRVGSLNSLADYGLGESDIEDFEDSDNELQSEDSSVKPVQLIPAKSSIPATQTRVKTSKRYIPLIFSLSRIHLNTTSSLCTVPCILACISLPCLLHISMEIDL